jgi:DinB superfamily
MLHPRIHELLDYLERQHAKLLQAIDLIPAPLRGRRPAPDRWSVADVMQHLALVEGRLARSAARGADRRDRRGSRCGHR